jgi:t-SNARE complex subunit (syntaxin)
VVELGVVLAAVHEI